MRVTTTVAVAGLALTSGDGSDHQNIHACNLVGDQFNVSFYYPDMSKKIHDAGNFVVPASGIDPRGFRYASIDINPRTIVVTYKSFQRFDDSQFHGYVLTDLNRNDISDVTIDKETTVSNFSASRLKVTGNSVSMNMEGISYALGQHIKLKVHFSCDRALISSLKPKIDQLGVSKS